jgi:hypothetical protein
MNHYLLEKVYRGVLIIGILFSIYLIVNDILSPGFCPKLFFVPACYMVLLFFLMPLLLTFFDYPNEKIISFVFLAGGFLTAVYFSALRLFANGHCPMLLFIPLCYASFFTFTALIGMRSQIKKFHFEKDPKV